MGERTYGFAGVQKAVNLDDGSALILTTAKYYAPVSAKAISETGVVPNNAVFDTPELTDDDDDPSTPPVPPAGKPQEDAPLKKAIEVLSK